MIKQEIIKRESYRYDNGTMGFHDYETKYEDFQQFVDRVTEHANKVNGRVVSISYPSADISIIAYRVV